MTADPCDVFMLSQQDKALPKEELGEEEDESTGGLEVVRGGASERSVISDIIRQKLKTAPMTWSSDEIVDAVVKV